MKQIFLCNHFILIGMSNDRQTHFRVPYNCPECKAKKELKPGFKTVNTGRHTLVIKRAAQGGKP